MVTSEQLTGELLGAFREGALLMQARLGFDNPIDPATDLQGRHIAQANAEQPLEALERDTTNRFLGAVVEVVALPETDPPPITEFVYARVRKMPGGRQPDKKEPHPSQAEGRIVAVYPGEGRVVLERTGLRPFRHWLRPTYTVVQVVDEDTPLVSIDFRKPPALA